MKGGVPCAEVWSKQSRWGVVFQGTEKGRHSEDMLRGEGRGTGVT